MHTKQIKEKAPTVRELKNTIRTMEWERNQLKSQITMRDAEITKLRSRVKGLEQVVVTATSML